MIACTNDYNSIDDINNDSISINNYIYKVYNTQNNTVNLSTDFQLIDNRISSYQGINFQTNQSSSGNYIYDDEKIVEILKFIDGDFISKQNFTYDSQGNLIELLTSVHNSNQNTYSKHSFNHTLDTIFIEHRKSLDGNNFDIKLTDIKILIDENDNRTYFERYDYVNDTTTKERLEFDSHQNLIEEVIVNVYNDGTEIDEITNTISYDNSINSLYEINSKMLSRKNLILTYHIFKNSSINSINAKRIAPNNIINFDTTFGNSVGNFKFENDINDNGFSQKNIFEFNFLEISEKFSYEYFFD